MTPTTAKPKKHRQRLGLVLFLVFALAMVMGPGPGLRLVNPEPAAAREGLLFLGLTACFLFTELDNRRKDSRSDAA